VATYGEKKEPLSVMSASTNTSGMKALSEDKSTGIFVAAASNDASGIVAKITAVFYEENAVSMNGQPP
jgi:glycine cleavage system regulatory protein